MASSFHPLKVADVARDTRDAVVLTFDLPPALARDSAFRPGQYLTLRTQVGWRGVAALLFDLFVARTKVRCRWRSSGWTTARFRSWANRELQPGAVCWT